LPQQKPDDAHIKRMAELLKNGSTMTNLACPVCASPLFRLKNEQLWCEKCHRQVMVVKEGEEARMAESTALTSLEATLAEKIKEIQQKMAQEQDPERLQKLGNTLTGLLENLERTRKMKKTQLES
jgi:UPF0148 protein